MDWSHISAQSALYELWLHLFPLTWPWEFNFLVSPQALFFICVTPHWILSDELLYSPHPHPPRLLIKPLRTWVSHFHSHQPSKLFHISSTCDHRKFQNCSLRSRRGHLPPILFAAVHLLAVVSMDVEWCPNPLKAHVGTVCISFSHLEERPQPSPFTGIPCPLSVQPQPKALA